MCRSIECHHSFQSVLTATNINSNTVHNLHTSRMFRYIYAFSIFCCIFYPVLGSDKINPSLQRKLELDESADILVSIRNGMQPVLQSLSHRSFSNRQTKLNSVVSALKLYTAESQKSIKEFLTSEGVEIEAFWITNRILVKNANSALVTKLSNIFEVSSIEEDEVLPLESGEIKTNHDFPSAATSGFAEWGVERIRAPEAWELDGGNNGAGAIVGSIDTGVRGSHEALVENFVGEYGWLDPYEESQAPNDVSGLGTHTMGIMVGSNGIGVAPGAKWMACKGCDVVSCSTSALLACGQFMSCPTLANGERPDCTKAPHLVSNSWGGGLSSPFFDDVIAAWKLQGIIPVFNIGGSGPTCETAYVASAGVLSIGSTTEKDELSASSSRGPGPNGEIKPDLCAPGQMIRSAYYMGDNEYTFLSGSSLGASHVAGVIALLKAEEPSLSFANTSSYLFNGANTTLLPTGLDCGGISETVFPNNAYGYGRVDAYESLLSLINSKRR